MRLIQYNPTVLTRSPHAEMPGMHTFIQLGEYFSSGLVFLDRTHTITSPLHMTYLFPIPKMRPFHKTFEAICNERARELLERADDLRFPLYVFWSGGIDSTLVLVSLLKQATVEQKKNLIVLLSEDSISENPRFYAEHVRGRLRMEPVMMYPHLLGTQAVFVSGEQNDQLFGADTVRKLINAFGSSVIHQPYTREKLFAFFNQATADDALTNKFLDMFERIMQAAPIKICSYFEYIWWINFATKWQNTYMRSLSCVAARNTSRITPEYMQASYAPFYGTDDFQLWSLNNPDKRIKDEWRTYKWVCKDIIYDYTNDAEYRDNKTKHGSLRSVIIQQNTYNFIDENFKFHDQLDPKAIYNPDNDFI